MFSCNEYNIQIVVNGLRTNTCVISINNQGRGKCFDKAHTLTNIEARRHRDLHP